MTDITETKEYKTRSKGLGKVKNHKREYWLLERILTDSFPMQFGDEPLKEFPDIVGWLYFHLEEVCSEKPTSAWEIADSLAFLEKVVSLAWEIRNEKGKRVGCSRWCNVEQTVVSEIPEYAREIGIKLELKKDQLIYDAHHNVDDYVLDHDKARTILHYMRFGKPDYEGNVWESSKDN